MKPNYSQAHANLGAVLQSQGEFEAAISSYNTAIALSPDYAEAILNKALLLLLRGDYLQGWLLYESRLQCDDVTHRLYKFSGQSWRGESSVARKKLLVYSEQGLGDVVQFCRYVPMLLIGDAEIIFEVQAPLYSLMETLDTRIKLIKKGSELPEVDFHCPVLSLPLVFNTTLDNVPATDAYLKSDPVKVSSWLRRLGTKSLPRIGIVWSGSPIHKNDHNRSIPVHELMPLFQITCEWHSLQKEYRAADLSALAGSAEVKQHQKYLSDFSETAALIECMDLVITVDTSVAHAAGALGKPAWILLAAFPIIDGYSINKNHRGIPRQPFQATKGWLLALLLKTSLTRLSTNFSTKRDKRNHSKYI